MKKWNNLKQESRNLKIVEMRDKDKLTFPQIAKVYNLTYQRAHIIYKTYKNDTKQTNLGNK